MAELVDALVSEASEETHGGSSPLGHTIIVIVLKSIKEFWLKDMTANEKRYY